MNVNDYLMLGLTAGCIAVTGCTPEKKVYGSYELYPVRSGELWEMQYTPQTTRFAVWSPIAEEARVLLYEEATGGHAYKHLEMKQDKEGTWFAEADENLLGKYYAFNVKINGKWMGDTPGINAKAVGVNGERAAIIDWNTTNPEGWEKDKRPVLKSFADIVLYEMHHRDFSIADSSGIQHKGKFLALTEENTVNTQGASTGIDHLKELGVTHVHLLPSFDYASIDETKLDENNYNWGYDPKNYNVPEGSYATDPNDPATRIREFKQMVQALHKAGIRVVLDVVYNHTYNTAASAFERTASGYFYRQKNDGTLADASACGNETASDRAMMRKYMIESVCYWANEYHIDGFRFDLMGIHDIETMNQIRKALDRIDPTIFIYGEGWAAGAPQLNPDSLAMKANTHKMSGIAAFSDELRDGLRGPFGDDSKGAFVAGIAGHEESLKFGIAGAIQHPQIDYSKVNYSKEPWAEQPTQMISYVSCHDDMCLVDRLKSTIPGIKPEKIKQLDKLAQTVVFTSQGVPFIYAGEEVMRDKQGVHNSYKSPDAINAIDWERKSLHADLFDYYRKLIQLRKEHPAFRMNDAELVRKHLEFLPVETENVVAFRLGDHANGDQWKDIVVAFNSNPKPVKIQIPEGKYTVVCKEGTIDLKGLGLVFGPELTLPAQAAMILYK